MNAETFFWFILNESVNESKQNQGWQNDLLRKSTKQYTTKPMFSTPDQKQARIEAKEKGCINDMDMIDKENTYAHTVAAHESIHRLLLHCNR